MCINYTINQQFKNKVITGIDKFNGGLIDFLDNFDDKCTELGNYFIRKYKFYFEKNRYTRGYSNYHFNNDSINTPLSPDEYEKIIIPDESNNSINKENIIHTIQPKEETKSTELVEKHIIDNRESFLDDAWDILNDTY